MASSKPLDQPDLEVNMSFMDHLESLRWHLLRSVVAILICTIGAFIFIDFIFGEVFMGPSRPSFISYVMICEWSKELGIDAGLCVTSLPFHLINTTMAGQFMTHLSISFSAGIVIAFPYFFWEIWRFFRPALSPRERRYTRSLVFFATALFFIGIFFGYFLITPITIQFLANYSIDPAIQNTITISDYVSMVTMTTLSIAIVFELPVVIYFLSLWRIVTPKLMRKYRRHAILIIVILSAVLTPGSDVYSLMAVSIPFYILFELSIGISAIVQRRKLRTMEIVE